MRCKALQREVRQLIAHFSLKERYAEIALAQLNQRYREEQENHRSLLQLISALEQQILSFDITGMYTYLELNELRRKQSVYRRQILDIRVKAEESALAQVQIMDDINKTNTVIVVLKKKVIKITQYSLH
ncbi:hypothetical protein L9H26_11705 [Morganella psychrotolerans]|uniref:Uncharacterized protein n=1 Tax=Morganella psychrotolerans TaxID=368603 RepID=A0A5M9R673_9GAMM|nr:hypothetical protein [Morganella psychrotolerans]KAA8715426.1 hypothetical protein F4V73_10640 [Morganella psychrotolerans]OBU05472.1 hypothetical protein AYY16_09440 [Morganella psychrotolerans]